jgi:hypothetical protein
MRQFRPGRSLAFGIATALASALLFAAPAAFAADDDKEESKEKSEDKDKDKDKSESKEEGKADASVNLSSKGKKLGSTTDSDSDHAMYVGAFALGYLGASEIPFIETATVTQAAPIVRLDATPTTLNAPVIGMRYWISDLLGIDAGIGFRNYSGSVKQHVADLTPGQELETNIEQKDVNQFGMLIHAGVPLALHAEKHWVFEVIPELNLGFSSGKMQDPAKGQYVPQGAAPTYMNDIKFSGLRFDVGARAGAELHFGFIGVPNLSLQATVGLYLRYDSYKAKGGGNPNGTPTWPDTLSYSRSNMTIGTSVQDAPWSIFTKNVAALYYF